MGRTSILITICAVLSLNLRAQVQSVNIAGSYSGSFLLSGTSSEYKINGSPYLTEDWMYGTIEMKREIAEQMSSSREEKIRINQINRKIKKCDELIAQLSDSGYASVGLSLNMAEIDQPGDDPDREVEISIKDFAELSAITDDLEVRLISFLTNLRAEYMAEISAIHEINGLFRYNLYAQEFEMIYEQDTFAIISPFDVQSISISNKKFIHGFYVKRKFNHERLGSAYFEVLNEGECKLMMKHDVKIKSGGGPVTYAWAGGDADSFVKYKQLYYQKKRGSEVIQLKKRKRDFRKVFGDKYELVDSYIRSEKLNVKDEKELVQLFNYYNKLDS